MAVQFSVTKVLLDYTWLTHFGRRAFTVCGPDIWNSLLLIQDSLTHVGLLPSDVP